MLSIGTYIPLVMINYKYSPMQQIIDSEFAKKYKTKIYSSYPIVSSVFKYLGLKSIKFSETTVQFIINQIENNYYKNNKINICPKKLTKAIIHSSVSYKLLLPVYVYSSYKLAQKSLSKTWSKN